MHGERRKMFREYYNTNVRIFVKLDNFKLISLPFDKIFFIYTFQLINKNIYNSRIGLDN